MRTIDLSRKSLDIYQRLLELSPQGEFLFQTKHGTPILINAINTYLRTHKKQMGIDEILKNFKSLIFFVHTHISKLAEIRNTDVCHSR